MDGWKTWVPLTAGALSLLVLAAWPVLGSALAPKAEVEKPLEGNIAPASASGVPEALLVAGPGKASAIPGAFTSFRGGPEGTYVLDDGVKLAATWPESGPKELWHLELGLGHAGFSVRDGRIFIQDHDLAEHRDMLRCHALADGAEIWRNTLPLDIKPNHGVSRGNPAVGKDYVASIGPTCVLTVFDPASGRRLWAKDLVGEYGTKVPVWWSAQSPFIFEDTLVVAVFGVKNKKGTVSFVAFDPLTGAEKWSAPNPRGWNYTHSSIGLCRLDGKPSLVYCADKGVMAVDPGTGEILWDTPLWQVKTATVTVPLDCGDHRIFLSGGYGSGCMMAQVGKVSVDAGGGRIQQINEVKELWRLKAEPGGYGSEQHGPILFNGHLYGTNTGNQGELVCLTLDGKQLWSSGKDHRFDLGPFLVAGGRLYALTPAGRLTLFDISPAACRPLASAQLSLAHNAWAPMTVVAGRLLVRDQEKMLCLDIAGK